MCLVVVALHATPRYPLIVAANRDEQHARPAERAAWWPDAPGVLAGRDLMAGGTWLALDRRGRLAAVTNVRDGHRVAAPRSRGQLVADYVTGTTDAAGYAQGVAADAQAFGPFNLLVFDGAELHYASNRAPRTHLAPGLHVVSNAPLGVAWPKTASAASAAAAHLAASDPLEGLFDLLAQRTAEGALEERYRTDHFVVGAQYGTRCSTVVLLDADGSATFAERSFDASGRPIGEVHERFALEPRG